MIPRYEDPEIVRIWSDPNKLLLWQKTELAVIEAQSHLGQLNGDICKKIGVTLTAAPIDISWWIERDKEIHHDLNAFVDERRRHLPADVQACFHDILTSYDAEEPAFAKMLKDSVELVGVYVFNLVSVLKKMADQYRFTPMMGRTHGQEAELQTFGKRCLTWRQALGVSSENLKEAAENLRFSKISGALGNYGSIDPLVEDVALHILGFFPFHGATQIMPREIYAPIAQALCQIVMTLDKIATDIRLGARSGGPLYQEPFSGKQKGSSRMPQKKNTISTEQIEGMARLAQGYSSAILQNIKTWEERAIEQSCVERVAWPDLFHITIHSLGTMIKVLSGLNVYPDNMMQEIIDSRGCYAAGEVKSFLADKGMRFGLLAEEAYRIVQLAAFNVFSPTGIEGQLRDSLPSSLKEAEETLEIFKKMEKPVHVSIQQVIGLAMLEVSPELDATEEDVRRWNRILKHTILRNPENLQEYSQMFSLSYLLRHEAMLFQEILGV